jgi:hypothetical protein
MSVEAYSPLVLLGPEEKPATGWVRNAVMGYPRMFEGPWNNESTQEGQTVVAHYVRSDRPDLRVDDAFYVTREEDEDGDCVGQGTYSYRVIRQLVLVWLQPDGTWFKSWGPGDVYIDSMDYDDFESAAQFAREQAMVNKAPRLDLYQGREDAEIREIDV